MSSTHPRPETYAEWVDHVIAGIDLAPVPTAPIWHANSSTLTKFVTRKMHEAGIHAEASELLAEGAVTKLLDRMLKVQDEWSAARGPLKIVDDSGNVTELIHRDGTREKVDPLAAYEANPLWGAF